MKRCPHCKTIYSDDSLTFCLQDGTPLKIAPTTDQEATTLRLGGKPTKKGRFRRVFLFALAIFFIIGLGAAAYMLKSRYSTDAGESEVLLDDATARLDLTSSWTELNEEQRKTLKASKGTLYGEFIVRKYDNDARFCHRLGTTSRFKPEWRSATHPTIGQSDERKCSPEVQYSYMLYFDIHKENIDVPFKLSYEIDFWNAHNGVNGDWHAFYVAHPTRKLTIKVSFPKIKPYVRYRLKSIYGKDCAARPELYENPVVEEDLDRVTGAKTISWSIDSPKVHWIYRIEWDW